MHFLDFKFKGFHFSGEPLIEVLSKNKEYITVAGIRWFTLEDKLMLNIKEFNFNKKQRGKKVVTEDCGKIPKHLTKRIIAVKVGEVFDLNGRVTPIIAHFKVDLRTITKLKLGWDDVIPDEFRACWVSHFEMMKEIANIKYRHAVIPEDAVSLDCETIT